jgi:hypothetical protein
MRRTMLLPITIVALAAVSALAIRPVFGSAWDTGMVTSPDPADSAASLRNPATEVRAAAVAGAVPPGRLLDRLLHLIYSYLCE